MTNAERILVVDDEKAIRAVLTGALEDQGFAVQAAASPAEALAICEESVFDLALIDLKMPGPLDGIDLLRAIRRRWPQTTVIMLSGYATLDSAISALREGAYDYLTKPASTVQILESVNRGLAKRREESRQQQLIANLEDTLRELKRPTKSEASNESNPSARFVKRSGLMIDRQKRLVVQNSCLIDLTPTEFDLLDFLAAHAGRVVTAHELIRAAQGYDLVEADARPILRVHLQRLRRKLGDDPKEPRIIQNVRGKGYRFVA